MSQVHEYEELDDDQAEVIDDPELEAELEAAIAEADADPDGGTDAFEFLRKLREGS